MANNKSWAIKPDKNRHQYVIGIDLGHGETSAAYAEIGWNSEMGELGPVKDIDLAQDKTCVIPSALAITENGTCYIGVNAFEHVEADFHVCFKARPTSLNGKNEQLMIKFMSAVYTLIHERMGAILNDNNHVIYIATPSGWDEQTQDLYGQMAAEAGLPIAGVTWESRAAFINAQSAADSGLPQYVDKGAVVFDMGSSTLDFTFLSMGEKPIDHGYDCGASMVEKIMYQQLREGHDGSDSATIDKFEQKYPQSVDRLLFRLRTGKERYYRSAEHKLRETIDFYDIVGDDELEVIRCSYKDDELDNLLEQKGYVAKIREAMQDFKNNHINKRAIYAAFFTGGASRMDFLQKLVEEEWKVNHVFRDQNPSLTVSRGVAEAARADIRSGGAANVKSLIKKLTSDIDVYDEFATALGAKIKEEVQASIATPVCGFKDTDEELCLADLELTIEKNIQGDVENINDWAQECLKNAFDNAVAEVRDNTKKLMANYSKQNITMGNLSTKDIELPDLDLNIISRQMHDLSASLIETSSMWGELFTGAAIGTVAAFILGGPLTMLAGLGAMAYKFFFGDNETEEEKREKAKYRALGYDERLRVYNEFDNNWSSITAEIDEAVDDALDDPALKRKINSQCDKILRDYANECIRQTRMMIE